MSSLYIQSDLFLAHLVSIRFAYCIDYYIRKSTSSSELDLWMSVARHSLLYVLKCTDSLILVAVVASNRISFVKSVDVLKFVFFKFVSLESF